MHLACVITRAPIFYPKCGVASCNLHYPTRPIAAMTDQADYSLYLVTDSTEAILGTKDLVQVVEDALAGGMPSSIFRITA